MVYPEPEKLKRINIKHYHFQLKIFVGELFDSLKVLKARLTLNISLHKNIFFVT